DYYCQSYDNTLSAQALF
nr:immunoglobulin light chain junction region [Macaca mulatta]MOX80317.1 immunoglobulin light chain junction region [Macaca mulatta]MOX80749.1 immunoglobulin light chain junction region [Macaca mulatta]MOX81108.1 immunoglobulin light chain junction region [Macaca mulatta]MOX81221.1 immunoglobulin light chain junction region [Macaca mulatta]